MLRILIFTVDTSTKHTALYSLRGQTPDMIGQFVIVRLHSFITGRRKLGKAVHDGKLLKKRLSLHIVRVPWLKLKWGGKITYSSWL